MTVVSATSTRSPIRNAVSSSDNDVDEDCINDENDNNGYESDDERYSQNDNNIQQQQALALNNKYSEVGAGVLIGTNTNNNDGFVNNAVDERDTSSSVRVAVRVRPLLAFEQGTDNCMSVMEMTTTTIRRTATVIRVGGQESGPRFTFDQVFDCHTNQATIFQEAVLPLITCCLEGYNATILAYGQTGSGKTFTIMGPSPAALIRHPSTSSRKRHRKPGNQQQQQNDFDDSNMLEDDDDDNEDDDDDDEDQEDAGVIPRAFDSLFAALHEKKENSSKSTQFAYQVSIQFLELYGEEIRDLLTTGSHTHRGNSSSDPSKKLTIRDLGTDEPEVVGATQQIVNTPEEALLCLSHGMLRRVTGATAMNESSSRSHAILSVLVEQQQIVLLQNGSSSSSDVTSPSTTITSNIATGATLPTDDPMNHVQVTHSRFNFVDLAGSERQKRTQAKGKRLQEGIDINKGLLVLGNVISALGDPKKMGKTFVPYRDSKLTRLLKGSLGGNHKTLMIACVSPSSVNMEESINCLRYANRARNIQNNAVVNVDGNSRIVQELQTKVQILATDLVRILTSSTTTSTTTSLNNLLDQRSFVSTFPLQVLEIMAKGGTGTTTGNTVPPVSTGLQPLPMTSPSKDTTGTATPSRFYNESSSARTNHLQNDTNNEQTEWSRKMQKMEIELSKTRDELRQTRTYHDAAEEELYVLKAQKELADLQVSVLNDSNVSTKHPIALNINDEASTSSATAIQNAYLQKAIQYEKQISELSRSLRETETKLERTQWLVHSSNGGGQAPTEGNEDTEHNEFIERAEEQLDADRNRLFSLQEQVYGEDTKENDVDGDGLRQQQVNTNLDQILEEQLHDEAEIQTLTKKYVRDCGDDDFEYLDQRQHQTLTPSLSTPEQQQSKLNYLSSGSPSSSTTLQSSSLPSTSQRARKVQADLAELSRTITAKENLIQQLKISQEKYSTMRDFYEDRLKKMESLLNEKENERESLLRDLKRVQEGDHGGRKVIEEKLDQKEKHIATLRKRQQELVKLTAVSSRNETEIRRLHDEVVHMKKLKVDLQKKLSGERKVHLKELKELQKTTLLKDKELTKVKRISSMREAEAARAQQMAKQRLDELSQLRTKYKDTEKKLRMASLKRGVLAKAGIDPVIIGKRAGVVSTVINAKQAVKKPGMKRVSSDESSKSSSVNVDLIRSYFDEKVAGVVRKEAIVDKLAREWEEHFELSNRKQELMAQKVALGDADDSEEAQQAIQIQIEFKEERIRKLASRLGQPNESPEATRRVEVAQNDAFLFDKEFNRLSKGCNPDRARVIASRVLFGMIVRERRRVAALARTASSLDERVQAAEKAAELSGTALRSYMDEQRHEVATLTQTQQAHILSLMDMVKEDSSGMLYSSESSRRKDCGPTEEMFQRKLLVLANERVALLEQQIEDLQTESAENNGYREKLEETKDSLTAKLNEYVDMHTDLLYLRAALRRIREVLTGSPSSKLSRDHESNHQSIVLDIVQAALDPGTLNDTLMDDKDNHSNAKGASPTRTKRRKNTQIDDLLSDSDGENLYVDTTPDWADDIMADLALIAEGILPPSLENSPLVLEGMPAFEKDKQPTSGKSSNENKSTSVFDRLSDPKQFTGTQKQARKASHSVPPLHTNFPTKSSPSIASQKRREERIAISKEVSNRLDKISQPKTLSHRSLVDKDLKLQDEGNKGYQSVFDRLVSPSHYTGTQKEKFHEAKQKREQTADQVAGRVLDGLLQSKDTSTKVINDHGAESSDASHLSRSHTLYSDYASQDVFERLQKTTTQAFAVKTHNPYVSSDAHPLHHHEDTNRWYQHDGPNTDSSKTTTTGTTVVSPATTTSSVSDKLVHSKYMRQDVFERLQKTTTEAYAKKAVPKSNFQDES